MGYELMKRAYQKAIEERLRFYSFGDAMFIF
jgi:S-adenosylmethionine:tRNA ribosyltransferase-isomerase